MIGINVNDSCEPYSMMIVEGFKTIETRNSPSLHPYVGQRVGIVQTGCGPARVVGYATIGQPVTWTSQQEFDRDICLHRVGLSSPYRQISGIKYGYPVTDVRKLSKPIPVTSRGIVARQIEEEYHGKV